MSIYLLGGCSNFTVNHGNIGNDISDDNVQTIHYISNINTCQSFCSVTYNGTCTNFVYDRFGKICRIYLADIANIDDYGEAISGQAGLDTPEVQKCSLSFENRSDDCFVRDI